VREQKLLTEVLSEMRQRMPFPLLGFDTDNDSVFMNETVRAYCVEAGLMFTRCRPYRKNDQAWVEQKNGAVVRRVVGYRRYEGLQAAVLLGRLYAALRLFVNFFQPSFKLAEKTRDGARVSKRYHPPATPYQRLIADPRRDTAAGDGDLHNAGPGSVAVHDPRAATAAGGSCRLPVRCANGSRPSHGGLRVSCSSGCNRHTRGASPKDSSGLCSAE
jgi:hypothetical protein